MEKITKEYYKAHDGQLFEKEERCNQHEEWLAKKKNDPKFTIKKFVFYTVDLEPLTIKEAKDLIDSHVFNRMSTNSIVRWKEVKEVLMYDEWHDEIKWNNCNTDLDKYEELFTGKNKSRNY